MKIVSLFVCPHHKGRMAVVATVQQKSGSLSCFGLDPEIEGLERSTLFAREVGSMAEAAASPLVLLWAGGAGPGPTIGPGGPIGPGGIPEAIAKQMRSFWDFYQRSTRDLEGGAVEIHRG